MENKECQWENCSGGEYCPKHSLLTRNSENKEWEKDFIEAGADLEHDRWSKWQKYMHSKILPSADDGIMLIGQEFVDRWNRQINTPYAELSEQEKESDRIEVRKYLPLIENLLDSQEQRIRSEARKEMVEKIKDYPQKIKELTPSGFLPFVIFDGKASESEKWTIYMQAYKDILSMLSNETKE